MRKISERGLFGVLVMIISMLAVQMSAFASNTYENSTQIKAQLQLDAEDEAVLNQYFQNRAENFYGNTVVDGWMKEEQLQRIAVLSQWMESCGFKVEKATVGFSVNSVLAKNENETVVLGSEWNTLTYKFNSENESRDMMFETMHVLHISEVTHEITQIVIVSIQDINMVLRKNFLMFRLVRTTQNLEKAHFQSRVCCGEWRHRS